MKIVYQGEPGSYMHQASLDMEHSLNMKVDEMIGFESFEKCWNVLKESIEKDEHDDIILVLAIENSYAGSIYENLYKFLRLKAKIIGEHAFEINHCLCSLETDIKKIKRVYSHFKALPQCYNYLQKRNITDQVIHPDTAGSAKMLFETKEKGAASICSRLAAEMYGMNVLDDRIQDQKGNTTRFVAITSGASTLSYSQKKNKISIWFDLDENLSGSLHKCLGAFADNGINLTKIESLPDLKNPFSYIFWVDLEGNLSDENLKRGLDKLRDLCPHVKIIGEY